MTGAHWWTARHHYETKRAFSVRPDLWPAGTFAWTRDQDDLARVIEGVPRPEEPRPDLRYTAPGAAEALILAGELEVALMSLTHLDWVPTESP